MKRKFYILIIILAIGFASVTTSLIIKGNTSISVNEADYDIYFSEAILDDVDKTNVVIDDTRQIINFDTKKLTLVGEKSILEYEVTNNSKQYDAEVKINCMVKDQRILDYVSLSYYIDKEVIPARTKANGNITVELIKAFTEDEEFNNSLTCEIVTSGTERDTLVSEEVEVKTYYTYGFLVNTENEPIKNAVVMVYANGESKYAITDDRGMFIIDNISSGEYTLYAIENISVEELEIKDIYEIASLANYQTTFHTKGLTVTFENNYLRYGKVVAGTPITHDVTFDTNGSSIESFDSKIIEGQEIGFLPSVDHDSLIFEEWLGNGETLTENTIVGEDTIILANYGEGVAKIGEKQFKTLNNAFQYVNTDDETTIEVIKDNSLTSSIETDKNIILDLKGKTVYFNDNSITNTGNLSIENGNIKSSGINALTNDGTMNLNRNLSIEHINKVNDTEDYEIIKNDENKTLIIDNISFYVDINYVASKMTRAISNYGNANISNSNIQLITGQIVSEPNSQITLINNEVYSSSINSSGRMFHIYGDCVIDGGTYAIKETNETSQGIIGVSSLGSVTIKSGTFDNTYGKGISIYTYAGSTLTMGEERKEINIIGNNADNYSLYNYGNLNIVDGTINATKTLGFLMNEGTMTIGTKTTSPTINSSEGCRLLTIKSNKGSSITNASINELNSIAIYIYANAKLTIDNANITQSNSTSVNTMFYVLGELIINDGTYKLSESNQTGNGLIQINPSGNVTINSGTFDNTYGKGNSIYVYSGATLNIGKDNKEINFFGNGANNYTLNNIGVLNILEGKINVSNSLYFIGDSGIMTLGTETTLPVIYGNDGCRLFEIRSNKGSTIVNANINELNNNTIYIYANAKLAIDNANITQSNSTSTNRMFYVLGELIINEGTYKLSESNQTGTGLMQVNPSGNVTINSGTFDNTYGKSNSIYVYSGATLNMGEENKDIKIIGNGTTSYTITSPGNLNILAGNIISENGYFIGATGILTVGTTDTTPTISSVSGYNILSIRSNNDNRIINGNIQATNAYAINVYENAKLTIDNTNITQSNSTSTTRAMNVSGELIINDGIFRIAEDNQKGYGLMNIQATGTVTINAGTFDNTYGTSNSIYTFANSTFNMGSENKKIEIIGNTKSSYTIYNYGEINIPTGNILIEQAPFIISAGNIAVGTENSKPTIESTTGGPILVINRGEENKITNANVISNNMHAIYIYEGSKLTIDNIDLEQTSSTNTNRALIVNGELVINDGTFKMGSANQTGKGLIEVSSTGKLNINSGTFDNTYGKANAIVTANGATFNIDAKDNEVNFIGNGAGSYAINNSAELNIISGKINTTSGPLIITNGKTTLGTDSTTPTLEGDQGCILFVLSGGAESKVINANINGLNSTLIYIYADATLTIDNINLNQSNSTSSTRAITVNGNLIINDGNFKIAENNTASLGLINLASGSNVIINSGIFDGSNAIGNLISAASSTNLTLGKDYESIDFIGSGNLFVISSSGYINILSGNITSIISPFIISLGEILVGSDNTTPKIEVDSTVFQLNSGSKGRILNADIKVNNKDGIDIANNANMIIDNSNIIQNCTKESNRLFFISGELTINNGTYLSNIDDNKSAGLFNINATGILNIDGGTFEYIGDSNMIYILEDGTINIGKNEQNSIEIISRNINSSNNFYYPMIANHGYINMYSGTIDANNSGVITQEIIDYDSSDNITSEEKLNYSATTKIFGGSLINNEKATPTIYMSAGRLEMSGGEVVNKANGLTIKNSGGTAIQTGGTSLNNFGVTVQ